MLLFSVHDVNTKRHACRPCTLYSKTLAPTVGFKQQRCLEERVMNDDTTDRTKEVIKFNLHRSLNELKAAGFHISFLTCKFFLVFVESLTKLLQV